MPCRSDVKFAILNKAFDELSDRRNTFTRISDNTIQINNRVDNSKTRAQNNAVAKAIARNLIIRAYASFDGHVRGEISQRSEYDPITVTLSVNPAYVEHEFNKLNNKSESTEISDEQERDDVNNNVGPNTRMSMSTVVNEPVVGTFEKFIQFKQYELNNYQSRLSQIKIDRNTKSLNQTQLEKLNKEERELRLAVFGSRELGVQGLLEEIADLKEGANIKAVSYYVEKDLKRLGKLAESNNIDDIREAEKIAEFYIQAGTFKVDEKNPFFEQYEIFKTVDGKETSEFELDQATRDQFEEWKRKAEGFQNKLNSKSKQILVDNINKNILVKNTYKGKQFTYGEVTYEETGLKDTDFVSMWTMDITHGIASHNGLIPQVMFSALVNSIEAKSAWSRDISKYVDDNHSDIDKELEKLGHSLDKSGILGIKGVSYNLFKQISKEGNETNNLVQRATKEFEDEKNKQSAIFSSAFNKARSFLDYEQRQKAINKAFEKLKAWRLANQIIIDPNRLTDEDYKKELVELLGESGYNEQVAEQQRLNRVYESDKQGVIEYALIKNGSKSFDELPDGAKNEIRLWELRNDPKKGYEDYNTVEGLVFGNRKENSYMKYNSFIPRKYKANIATNIDANRYDITNTEIETEHYDKNYEKIQSNPVLADFYGKLKEFCETIYEHMDPDLQEKTTVYTLPGLIKTSAEIMNDRKTGLLASIVPAFRAMLDRFRASFGVVKQGNISYATTDVITGKPNYKVNDGFLRNNSRAIENRVLIERTKFLQSFNSDKKRLDRIKNTTSIPLNQFSEDSLLLLADYLHADLTIDQIRNNDLSSLKSKLTGDRVDIGRLINDFSLHSVVQSLSFDLPKLMKYFSEMTMAYAARKEALPIMEIMKKHYEKIQNPDTNNIGQTLYNKILGKSGESEVRKVGLRTGANRQMDDWFERVVIDNYGNKHVGVFGSKKEGAFIGETIYTNEEKKELAELDKLIAGEKDEKVKAKLQSTRNNLGRTRTATALFDNMLNWIRTLRLGYNVSSMTTNFLEGVTSNMILAATDEYFDPKEIFFGYRVIKHSFIKNTSFGYVEHPLAKKNRSLVDKFGGIIDSRNELQKNYATKILDATNPHAGNQRVEYVNQSPLMIAILRTMKIKDKQGNENSVWDAYDNDGHLLDDFRTPENIENWEALSGDQYQVFKQKFGEVRNLGHGNYDKLRGMMIKSGSFGKAVGMFKTWLPEALYWRFGTEQDNIRTGQTGVKGRYWSYGAGTAAVHGAAVMGIMFGLPWFAGGYVAGALLGKAFGTDSGIGMIQESIEATRLLAKKMIGMPINLIVGKQVIDINNKSILGKGKYFEGKGSKFTIQDQRNLNANMADISIQLAWLGLILLVKGIFWDDDDDSKDPERIAHNILVNKLMQLSSQASTYTNPSAMKETLTNVGIISYLDDLSKEVQRAQKAFDGQDRIATGLNAGKSGLWLQTRKILLPGIFRDSKFGFSSQADKVYPKDSPYQRLFHSEDYLQEDAIKRQRATMRDKLKEDERFRDIEDEDEQKKEINKEVDEEIPTLNKLKKLGYSSLEEYQNNR